ncbi:fungal-specific transcription factor domain-containing protein [Aspergillus granulosus]|uniref:Fungal-specific transcription factor domain-containing protein n=1 Tax=Aspergillus granulosus TaxID=176169 RepID=A0ABR4I2K6_9EURO
MDSAKQKPFKQACDNCRRRKIKCSRELPCDKCQRLLLSCSYSDVLRRKGPKFRTLYPLAPIHPLAARQRQLLQGDAQPYSIDREWFADLTGYPLGGSPNSPSLSMEEPPYLAPDLPDSLSRLPPPELVSSPGSTNSYSDSPTGAILPCPRILTPPVLLAHVNVYLKYMFPIMPVVRREELQQDCHHPERLSPQRYAFLASLCAATHIQLKLDGSTPGADAPQIHTGVDGSSLMSGEELLTEAIRARKDCDPIEHMNVESLLTSFFLFAAYGNLDQQEPAWFYLCQATSMIFTLGLHRESTYSEMNTEEAEEKRRVFWLLFITERGYALQQAKPVMLRNSIHKPQVLCSDDPILAYGFINLIGVFENLSVNLYDWVSAGGRDGSLEMPPTSAIQANLSKPISLDGVSEIQKVDVLITQQWLQAMMWKLSMTRASQPGCRNENVLPFHLPVLVGKAVMSVIADVSQGALDAHGIGMVSLPFRRTGDSANPLLQEQKLFDLGASVADVTRSLSPKASHSLAESVIEPRELLWGILSTLSRIRGSQSYLFPSLLERSKGILTVDCSLTIGNFLPPLPPASSSEHVSSWPASEDSNSRATSNTWDVVSLADELGDNADPAEPVSRMLPPTSIPTDLPFQPRIP